MPISTRRRSELGDIGAITPFGYWKRGDDAVLGDMLKPAGAAGYETDWPRGPAPPNGPGPGGYGE